MKKYVVMFAAIAVISLLLLAGCTPKVTPTPDVIDDTDTDTSASDDSSTDTTDDIDTTPVVTMSKELTKILSGLEKIKSYSYAFQSGTPESKQFAIKGDKILVTLLTKDKWKSGEFYDKVLIDTTKQEAYGFCTDREACNANQRGFARKVSYSEYYPPVLPMEFAQGITSGDITGTENFENQPTTIVQYEDEKGNTVQVSLSNYYGIPLRIVTISPSGSKKDTQFNRMAINSVADTDVEFPAEIKTFGDE